MPFETPSVTPRRIAVVGGGISGLGAALRLSQSHNVVLFEAEGRLGGHARTKIAGRHGNQPVDTGFIVFNRVNYPNLVRLFEELDIPIAESRMSFGASLRGGRIEYGLADLRSIFAQPQNALRPSFLRMLRDIMRFNAEARNALTGPDMTIGDLTIALGLGDWFREYYLAPFSGAIWSTPTQKILDFPAEALVRFFENHALMGYHGQHQWYTVEGGSQIYVDRLSSRLERCGVDIRKSAQVCAVRRGPLGVEVRGHGGAWEGFDEVVFATHSDDTLAILQDPTPEEHQALSAIRYQPNKAVLHADPALMPKHQRCWSSWVYTEGPEGAGGAIGLSYWMNSLQPIPHSDPMFVTLNPTREIRSELTYDETTFRHPVYDAGALAAQTRIRALNGTNQTWFCGAWMKNGFHEDGLSSAIDVADAIAARDTVMVAAE